MTAPVRAALYLRVSTGRQADSDLSIPDQRRQAMAYCTSRGWEIVADFVEPGVSAAAIFLRTTPLSEHGWNVCHFRNCHRTDLQKPLVGDTGCRRQPTKRGPRSEPAAGSLHGYKIYLTDTRFKLAEGAT